MNDTLLINFGPLASSIICQKLAMEELPYLKEKQALKFEEKFSYLTFDLNSQRGTSFEILFTD